MTHMKTITASISVLAVTTFILCIMLLFAAFPVKDSPAAVSKTLQTAQFDLPASSEHTAEAAPAYIITLIDGELRLTASETPGYTVLRGIDPRTLREADRAALIEGLPLDSDAALQQFFEDFGS